MANENRPLPYSTRVIYALFDSARTFGWNRLFWSVAALAVAAVLASGFYVVKKEEQGVLVRFGKVVDENIGPGIHYCMPFIYETHIRKVKRIVRVPIVSEGTMGDTHVTLLSGDTNLVELDVAVQYRIDNLRNYLFAVTDPTMLMTMTVREEMVNIVGQNFIDLILTSNRSIIERHLHDYLAGRLEAIDIGIELVDLNIVDIRPIEETVEAFRDVNDAISERMQSISAANQRRERAHRPHEGAGGSDHHACQGHGAGTGPAGREQRRRLYQAAGRIPKAAGTGRHHPVLATHAHDLRRGEPGGRQPRQRREYRGQPHRRWIGTDARGPGFRFTGRPGRHRPRLPGQADLLDASTGHTPV